MPVLAELVIIVVGVLIALYADRWNQGRQERELEAHYIDALRQDLRADTAALAENASGAASFAQHARRVLTLFDGATWDGSPEDLARSIELGLFLAWNYPIPLSRGTIDDLRTTGNLRLIRSEEVRIALGSYYGVVQQANVWARQWQDIQLGGWSLLPEVFNADQRLMLLGEVGNHALPSGFYLDDAVPESAALHISEEEAVDIVHRLRATPALKNELQNMLYVHAWVWDQLEVIGDQARTTLEVLDAYAT